jgi:hypothetical protein
LGKLFASIAASADILDGCNHHAAQDARREAKMVFLLSVAATIALFACIWFAACALGDALAYFARLLDRLEDGPATQPSLDNRLDW